MTFTGFLAMDIFVRQWQDYMVAGLMLLAAILMFRNAARSPAVNQKGGRDNTLFWILCGLFLGVFALIKSLNVLAFVGGWIRELAKVSGSYDGRRSVQLMLISLIIGIAIIILLPVLSQHKTARRHWPVIVSIIILGGFGLVRFVSLHSVDAFMGQYPFIRTFTEILATMVCIYWALAKGETKHRRRTKRTRGKQPAILESIHGQNKK